MEQQETSQAENCPICLDPVSNYRGILDCNHEYCKECISEWTNNDNSCPLCKHKSKTLRIFVGRTFERSQSLKDKQLKIEQEITQAEREVAAADSFCYMCEESNCMNVLLVCDSCVRKCCHIFCLEPPLEFIPEGDWYCDFCVRAKGLRGPNPTARYFEKQLIQIESQLRQFRFHRRKKLVFQNPESLESQSSRNDSFESYVESIEKEARRKSRNKKKRKYRKRRKNKTEINICITNNITINQISKKK